MLTDMSIEGQVLWLDELSYGLSAREVSRRAM